MTPWIGGWCEELILFACSGQRLLSELLEIFVDRHRDHRGENKCPGQPTFWQS